MRTVPVTEFDLSKVSLRAPEYVPDMTTTVGRLRHLRHVVEQIPAAQFDISSIMEKTDCGSVGCMIGWAGLDPHFNAVGLTSKTDSDQGRVYVRGVHTVFTSAGSEIFGISLEDSTALFCPLGDMPSDPPEDEPFTLAHGLARIDRMIAKYEKAS
jgi:hypothetical protein